MGCDGWMEMALAGMPRIVEFCSVLPFLATTALICLLWTCLAWDRRPIGSVGQAIIIDSRGELKTPSDVPCRNPCLPVPLVIVAPAPPRPRRHHCPPLPSPPPHSLHNTLLYEPRPHVRCEPQNKGKTENGIQCRCSCVEPWQRREPSANRHRQARQPLHQQGKSP